MLNISSQQICFFQIFIRIHVDKYRKVVNENEYLLYREDIHFHPSLSYITHHPPQPQSPSPIIQRNQSWTLIPPSHSLPTTSIYHAHCQPLSIIYYLPFIIRTPPPFPQTHSGGKDSSGQGRPPGEATWLPGGLRSLCAREGGEKNRREKWKGRNDQNGGRGGIEGVKKRERGFNINRLLGE